MEYRQVAHLVMASSCGFWNMSHIICRVWRGVSERIGHVGVEMRRDSVVCIGPPGDEPCKSSREPQYTKGDVPGDVEVRDKMKY